MRRLVHPDDPDVVAPRPLREQLAGTMFDAPDPPTGPAKQPGGGNTWRAYLVWRGSPDGQRSWGLIERMALEAAREGVRRISVNALVERVRATVQLEVNNTWRAWLADDLVRRHPHLMDLIERRKRTKVA